jgi:hypothetical protein
MVAKQCKDCLAEGVKTRRNAKYPGPRCATHHRATKKKRRDYSHKAHVEETYNITYEQYWRIYELQGGKCYICRRANGTRRKLSVDHDHKCCSGSTSCGNCVRGLLCRSCNRNVLGHLRDEVAAFERAVEYLINPPARQILD